jgi:hypothetical protein
MSPSEHKEKWIKWWEKKMQESGLKMSESEKILFGHAFLLGWNARDDDSYDRERQNLAFHRITYEDPK